MTWRDVLQRHVEVPLMVRLLRLPQGGRVLEIGCGTGNALPALRRLLRPDLLVGVDRAGGDVTADVRRLPFADAAFDLVVDFGTLHHVAALDEVLRVVRPGGLLVHETALGQLLAHPRRVRRLVPGERRWLPWSALPR